MRKRLRIFSKVNQWAGSPAYMAPEILVEEAILKSAGIEQLKAIDVCALVMNFFVTLNPDQKNLF